MTAVQECLGVRALADVLMWFDIQMRADARTIDSAHTLAGA
jgi:hypothetical protein